MLSCMLGRSSVCLGMLNVHPHRTSVMMLIGIVDHILSGLQNADTSDYIVIVIDIVLEMTLLPIIGTASIDIGVQVDVSAITCRSTHQTCHVA